MTGSVIIIEEGGTVATTGDGTDGISSTGEGATITSNGTITTTGAGAHGIDLSSENSVVINTGSITAEGVGIRSSVANDWQVGLRRNRGASRIRQTIAKNIEKALKKY